MYLHKVCGTGYELGDATGSQSTEHRLPEDSQLSLKADSNKELSRITKCAMSDGCVNMSNHYKNVSSNRETRVV